jgi:hypothetical protein
MLMRRRPCDGCTRLQQTYPPAGTAANRVATSVAHGEQPEQSADFGRDAVYDLAGYGDYRGGGRQLRRPIHAAISAVPLYFACCVGAGSGASPTVVG